MFYYDVSSICPSLEEPQHNDLETLNPIPDDAADAVVLIAPACLIPAYIL